MQGLPSSVILDSVFVARTEAGSSKQIAKDYRQPLQFWLYKRNQLVWAEVNCYAGGFPNLKWQIRQGGKSPMEVRNYLALYDYARLTGLAADTTKQSSLVVVWSEALGRQNKRFLQEVRTFLKAHPGTATYYFNADRLLN